MIIQLQKLILILVRITAFFVVCPGFSFRGLPNTLKIALAASLSIVVYMVTPEIEIINELLFFFILTIKETLFGLSMGYVTNLVFTTMEIAGQLIDFQVGFSMASVFDASLGKTASNYGKIYYWLSICVFFLLDMHHKIIEAIIKSFDYIPLTTVNLGRFRVESIIYLFSKVFGLSLSLAAPIIIVVLVTDIVLGVISRTVPQINVLMLGMPLKAMVSFLISMLTISWLIDSMGDIIQLIPGYLDGFMGLF